MTAGGSFNIQEELLEDHLGLFQNSNLNLLQSKTKNFSNSFVLNSFNPKIGSSMNFFNFGKSKSFTKGNEDFFGPGLLQDNPAPEELRGVMRPVENVSKFFDLPKDYGLKKVSESHVSTNLEIPRVQSRIKRKVGMEKLKEKPSDIEEEEDEMMPLFDKNRRKKAKFDPDSLNEVVIERVVGKEKVKKKIFKKRNKNNLIKTLSFLVYHYIKQKTFLNASKEIPTIFDAKKKVKTVENKEVFLFFLILGVYILIC